MNKPTTDKARAFLAQNPTFIGRVNGVDLYEHPARGDESPLVAITSTGRVRLTDCWELPDALSEEGRYLAGLI
jgi:hypothetical protein